MFISNEERKKIWEAIDRILKHSRFYIIEEELKKLTTEFRDAGTVVQHAGFSAVQIRQNHLTDRLNCFGRGIDILKARVDKRK